MTRLKLLSADEALSEVRRLYFRTTKATITEDLSRAIQLLTSMTSEDARERATVYMEGLTQMRSDWARAEKRSSPARGRPKRRVPKR